MACNIVLSDDQQLVAGWAEWPLEAVRKGYWSTIRRVAGTGRPS